MTISRVDINVPDAIGLEIDDDKLTVQLNDARVLSVPLSWFPRLVRATATERSAWHFVGRGQGVHWDELDEDISVEGLLAGRPSGESRQSLQRWLDSRAQK